MEKDSNENWLNPHKPYSIAHRGASAYYQENTIESFFFAAKIGADSITAIEEFLPMATRAEKIIRDNGFQGKLLSKSFRASYRSCNGNSSGSSC